jgi:hypothetical protein
MALQMVNEARRRLAIDCHWSEDCRSYSSKQYDGLQVIPADYIKAQRVIWSRGTSVSKHLEQMQGIHSYADYNWNNVTAGTDLDKYFFCDGVIVTLPPLSAAADTDALNGAINDSVTTIVLDDASWLPMSGRIKIDNEKIRYSYRNATTLYGCYRGDEGTTAASHLNDAVVTELNIWLFYYNIPADLAGSSAVDHPFELFPNAIVYYICWQAKLHDLDDTGGNDGARAQAEMYRSLWEMEKIALRTWVQGSADEPWSIRIV